MQTKKGKFNVSQKNNDGKPSNFVVDLRAEFQEEAVGEKKKFSFDKFDELVEKYDEMDFKKYLSKAKEVSRKEIKVDKEKVKSTMSKIVKHAQPVNPHEDARVFSKSLFLALNFFPGVKNWYIMHAEKLNSLAFFAIFKFLLKIVLAVFLVIYKICYSIGWVILFLARLVYFSFVAVLRLIGQAFNAFIFYTKLLGSGIKFFVVESLKFVFVRKELVEDNYEYEDESLYIETSTDAEALADKYDDEEEIIQPKRKILKPVMAFVVLVVALVLPLKIFAFYKTFNLADLKGRVLGASEEAIGNLFSGGQDARELNFGAAKDNFSQAANEFLKAQDELSGINDFILKLASLAPNENLKLASESKNILAAGEIGSRLGNNLSLTVDALLNNQAGDKKMRKVLDNFIQYGGEAKNNAKELEIVLNKIDENNLPEKFRKQFSLAKASVGFLTKGLDELLNLAGSAKVFLGTDRDQRYLLVFQNNSEMRATGGFIGSFALVDFSNGELKNIEVPGGGSYDTEAGLKERIIAPQPLHLISSLWHFWDANWWPDWETSAKKLMWFYEKSNGPTVDGVIAITPTVLENILSAIGPVDMTKEYGVVITAENFWETTRGIIEDTVVREKGSAVQKPKMIIGDLSRKIMEELPKRMNKETLARLAKVFEKSLNEKQILFYFTNEELENKIKEYGWDGSIKQTTRDYLAVINTNIAGGKSDRKIKEEISHKAEIQEDGSIIDEVEIKRTHTGIKYENYSGVRNVNWMRVYVPLGSELLEASGFNRPNEIYFEKPEEGWKADPDISANEGQARTDETSGVKIYEEAGKTIFADWSMVDPGETVVVHLKYKLPFRMEDKKAYKIVDKIKELFNSDESQLYTYALLAQKQSGSLGSAINSQLVMPKSFKMIWNYPEKEDAEENGWNLSDKLDTDKYWAGVLEK